MLHRAPLYPGTYEEARQNFREAASNVGARLEQHTLPESGPVTRDNLSIDVAVLGAAGSDWSVVVSTGLHGIEGFFGSAIQTAYLENIEANRGVGELTAEVVFIHSLNPFGFDKLRRVNEDNVDLNRNFVLPGEQYKGVSDAYVELNNLLNTAGAPRQFDLYLPKALWKIVCVGTSRLKQAIAEGQYEYPQGIFFGGHGPCATMTIVNENLARWVSGTRVIHLDFHSGLGNYAKYKLVCPLPFDWQYFHRYETLFGTQVESLVGHGGVGYTTRGDLGRYLKTMFRDRDYHFLYVEFGTYSPIRVLRALRRENQAHFFTPDGSCACQYAKAELLECFCPADPYWRASVLQQGLQIIERARQVPSAFAS